MRQPAPAHHRCEGNVPRLDISGTAYEAGVMLGYAWKEALHHVAATWPTDTAPWWMDRRHAKLVARYVPHIPDLYRGMAKGAGIPERRCAEPAPGGPAFLADAGCTSFAIAPEATLDGIPISGQTKDTGLQQQFRYQVLRLRMSDAPSALTLTYPGLLFGHGFVAGGCAIFRNSLYAGEAHGELAYEVWGLLALHCHTVADVEELTRRHGVHAAGHCSVADEHGGIIGLEFSQGGIAVLKPKRGIYVHANAVMAGTRLARFDTSNPFQANSRQRTDRLRARLEADRGRLTPQLAFMATGDHANYPVSICRHEELNMLAKDTVVTSAAVVVEPARRRLTCTRGAPCMNWPTTYSL